MVDAQSFSEAARRTGIAKSAVCVVPHFMVADDIARGRAELLLEGKRRAEIGVYAVVAKSRGLPLRIRRLIEHLQRAFSAPSWRETLEPF